MKYRLRYDMDPSRFKVLLTELKRALQLNVFEDELEIIGQSELAGFTKMRAQPELKPDGTSSIRLTFILEDQSLVEQIEKIVGPSRRSNVGVVNINTFVTHVIKYQGRTPAEIEKEICRDLNINTAQFQRYKSMIGRLLGKPRVPNNIQLAGRILGLG